MNRIKLAIFISIALSALATAVILPILGPLVRELHLSASQGGWMISIGSIAMAVAAAAWGAASDRFGRKPIMLWGFAGLFLSYVLYTSAIGFALAAAVSGPALFVLLCVTRAVVGGFLPAVPAGAQALMADNTGAHERSSGMAVIGAANGVGFVLGPALGGLVALQGLIWPLVLATALCFIAFFVVLVVVPKAPARVRDRPASVNPFAPPLLPWLLAGVLTMCAIVTLQISGSFYFQDQLGLTAAETGPLLAIALTLVGVAMLLAQVLQVRLLRWPARRMVLVGAVFWVCGLLVLLLTASAASYFLAYALLGTGAGLLMPGYMAGASLAVPADRQGAVAGFAAATQGVGFILGPVASTTLYELSRPLPLWYLVILMAALFILFALPIAATRPVQAAAPSARIIIEAVAATAVA